MTIRRWFFKEAGGKIFLYDTPTNDTNEGVLIRKPKSKKNEELGPVLTIETTEGNEKASQKYGIVFGLLVSI